jgi:hypothetical protein
MSQALAPNRLSALAGIGVAVALALFASLLSPAVAANASTASDWASTTYGNFAPVTLTGRGTSVVSLPAGARAGYLTATHNGRSNFIVHSLDAANSTVEYIFNEIGVYSGSDTFGMSSYDAGSASRLSVRADGNWSITVLPFSQAAELPSSGIGSGVYLYSGLASDLTLTHSGQRNFIVWFYGSGNYNTDLLVNEIGTYSGTMPLPSGPAVITVNADGAWTASRVELAVTPVAPPVVTPPVIFPPSTTPTSSTPTVKKTAPHKPSKPSVTSKTRSSIKIAWKKPSNGGSAVTKYKVRLYKGAKLIKTVTVNASKRTATFKKLKSKTGYKISVQAGNAIGYSKTSTKTVLKTL